MEPFKINDDESQAMKELNPYQDMHEVSMQVSPSIDGMDQASQCDCDHLALNKPHNSAKLPSMKNCTSLCDACRKMFDNGKLRGVINKRRVTRKGRVQVQGRVNCSVKCQKRNIKNHNCRCKQTRRRGIQKTKGCQCLNVILGDRKINIVYGLDSNFEHTENNRVKRVEKKCQTQGTSLTKAQSCTSEKTDKEGSLGYPETSIASLSSYRSLSSTNPEPML